MYVLLDYWYHPISVNHKSFTSSSDYCDSDSKNTVILNHLLQKTFEAGLEPGNEFIVIMCKGITSIILIGYLK